LSSKRKDLEAKAGKNKKSLREEIDELYFEGYSNPKIHLEMVEDSERMKYFQRAIQAACQGKTVLDIGAGTGVLSIMAAQSGALSVTGIENSEIYLHALDSIDKIGLK
jgi:type I protein arginine methyltransferase